MGTMQRSLFLLSLTASGLLLAQGPAPATAKPKAPVAAKPKPAKTSEAPPPAPAEAAGTGDQTVITIGDEKITENEFNGFVESLPAQYRAQAEGPMKRQMAEQIASMRLLANEARRRGLDKDKTLQNRIKLQTENMLAGAALNDLMKSSPVDEEAARKYYEAHKGEYEQAQARHILVRFKGSPVPMREGQKELTEEEALAKAQALRKRLEGGEDFATLAKAESDDTGSGANGGDLGTFKRGSMVPAFEEAAFKLPINELSEPIRTQFGYHIIRADKRESKPFEEVRAEIEGRLKPEMAQKAVENLKAKSNITYNDAFFGPPAAAAPPPGAPVPAAPPTTAAPPAGNKQAPTP